MEFLLFDNTGFSTNSDGTLVAPADDQLQVRKALRAFIPDSRHAIFGAVLVIYLALTLTVSAAMRALERRLTRTRGIVGLR